MKLFVYEFVTGGGTWQTAGSIEPAGSLLAEGRAMAAALISDLSAADIEFSAMLDARLNGSVSLPCPVEIVGSAREEVEVFRRLVQESDATLLIAPEIGGALLNRCRTVEELGGRLVSPGSRFVAIAADKQATAERLSGSGVRVPPGVRLGSDWFAATEELFPAVIKPCDGAGSWLVTRVSDRQQFLKLSTSPAYQQAIQQGGLRIERFVSGLAASAAVLCGPAEYVPLLPCEQVLGGEGFEYLGGRLPLDPPLAQRARQLALAAVKALPPATGYVGVDLILGPAADGSEDYVIEINPRLTTSYIGLRRACRQNLAKAMLAVAAGQVAALSFDDQPVEFRADGTIHTSPHTLS
ncbi:MAG TPA: ATP-grasp domain-containing protein [Pirellulaceae bacterium]|nr:ATP-grasp domain-containing protein [Pirellulaceae bacterium]